jgi:NAD(P)-dependent dehydrogenase (short-subunit alcohol dehydrogenase family)
VVDEYKKGLFDVMTSMQGKVCLVTGATAGIGEVTARELARMGAIVVGVGRNPQKSASVEAAIKAATGNPNVEFLLADLSVQAQVRHLAEEFRSKYRRLDVLVNNAGGYFATRQETADGIELTFALNHLSYFLLTNLLLDILLDSAPARVVSVSSGAHTMGVINFDDLQGTRSFGGWGAYAQSKLANVLFTYELARRLEGSGVTATVLHPGFVATNFAHNNNEGWTGKIASSAVKVLQRIVARTPEKGAETSIYLATSPEAEGVTGEYFSDKKAVKSSAASYDLQTARRLWQVSEEMTGLMTGATVTKR